MDELSEPDRTPNQDLKKQDRREFSAFVDGSSAEEIDRVMSDSVISGRQTSSEEDRNSRTLFVGNIGYRETWKDVKDFFSKFGKVSYVHIIHDHIKRRSKGIGFVEFDSVEGASICLEADHNELLLHGRILRVNYSSERKQKKANSFFTRNVGKLCENPSIQATDQVREHESCYTDMLLDEMWKKIFSYLSVREVIRLERVCKRFQVLALQFWRTKTSLNSAGIFSFQSPMTDKILKSLLARCGDLFRLDISSSSSLLTDNALDVIGQHCSALKDFNMSRLRVSNKAMQRFSSKVPHLKVIRLRECNRLSEKGLWYLFHNCKLLEHFDIAGHLGITGKCFHMVGNNLQVVVLNDCLHLTDYGVVELSRLCPRIKELQIQSCVQLSNNAISAIANGMPSLRVLQVGGRFPKITETVWEDLGNLHNLEVLQMDFSDLLTNVALMAIIKGCPKLKNLNISGSRRDIDDTSAEHLADLEHLTILDIGYHDKITDQTLYKLALKGKLEKLVVRACTGITDKGVAFALEHLLKLSYMDLSGNLQVSARGLAHLADCDRPCVELYVGGSSIELDNIQLASWLAIHQINLSNDRLHPSEVIWLPELDEELQGRPGFEYHGEGDFDDYDDFLETDDALNMERWDRS